ncbi:MAG: aldo/keto reductase [Verrucomicrobiota bacterium]
MNPPPEPRRDFFKKTVATSLGLVGANSLSQAQTSPTSSKPAAAEPQPIWKNRHPDMHYRMLGRTGMMISEIAFGTFPYETPDIFPHFDSAIEKGINYFDCAFAYGQGRVETNLGNYFKQSGNREKVFLTTKLSAYNRAGALRKIFEGLPQAKQKQLRKKADDLIEERMVLRPGYHFSYFGGQSAQISKHYLASIVFEEYGLDEKTRENIKRSARKNLAASLERLQTDYVDVLFLPHGAAAPDLEDEIIAELFAEFKGKGLIKASATSFHNDVAGNLTDAYQLGYYDAAMFAYNIANHAAVDPIMLDAKNSGMGLLAMKTAKLFFLPDQPAWILEKLNATYPGDQLSPFAKSYHWALQNPNLTACVSQMEDEAQLLDNLQAVGKAATS